MGLFKSAIGKLRKGLERTRDAFVGGLRSVLSGRTLDDDLIRELEARLIQADVGVPATRTLIEGVRADHKAGLLKTGDDVLDHITEQCKDPDSG
ncbi:MAG: signal recognition particle receptor subunit alpha, partial [Planctomycetota bacterium]